MSGLDEQGSSSPSSLAVVINNKTSFSKDFFFFFFFCPAASVNLHMPPTLTVRSLNHWAAREVPPKGPFDSFPRGLFQTASICFSSFN